MSGAPPVFVDCDGEIAEFLTDRIVEIVSDIDIHWDKPASEAELIDRLSGRQHAMVYMAYLSSRVLAACPALKTVTYLATGLTTHVDMEVAHRCGVEIQGVKGYGDRAVAEHAVTLMLCGLKQIALMDRRIRAGEWQLHRGEELAGKTIGLLGLGGIGNETAAIAAALGAHVIGWNRSSVSPDGPVTVLPLEEVLRRSDILSLHLALTPQTERFLDAGRIACMKPGGVLVNTARAALVDQGALMEALRSGQLAHAALDVFHDEPPGADNPLFALDSVTLTSHSAWFTGQAIGRLLEAGFTILKQQIDRHATLRA
ncbi:MAG: 2-hydroxyacid dehydrogenase [Gammaproteobacteria bacterium]